MDYVDYLKFSESECYLRREFEQSFKYELRGLLFVPQNQVMGNFQLQSSLPFQSEISKSRTTSVALVGTFTCGKETMESEPAFSA